MSQNSASASVQVIAASWHQFVQCTNSFNPFTEKKVVCITNIIH